MRKILSLPLLLIAAIGVFAVANHAFAAGTLASAQGPMFQGAPTVPSLNLSTSQTISTCVGDGGFTNCTSAPQLLTVSQLQSGTCTLAANTCTLLGSQGALADGGAVLPNLTATTVVLASPVITGGDAGFGCSALTEAPGGDGGVVVITCGGTSTAAVTAQWIRLN